MTRSVYLLIWMASATLTSGCVSFFDDSEEEAQESGSSGHTTNAQGHNTKMKSNSELLDERELKLARLWARVDELGDEQLRQKEKLKLLERGLTLGIIPDELKNPHPKESAPSTGHKNSSYGPESLPSHTSPGLPKNPLPKSTGDSLTSRPMSANEEKAYQDSLALAHDHFRAGRYGRAIVEFDLIGKKWGDLVPGAMAKYWVAKCWVQLKEFTTARQLFADFITSHGTSPWVPRAKLELARLEWRLGQNETAIRRFRDLIRDHPFEDAAEMAKMELSQVDKNL